MHLSTIAQKRIQQWYNMRIKLRKDCTPETFLDRAEGTFRDPSERKNVMTLLGTTKQKSNESLLDFMTRFEDILVQVSGDDWHIDIQANALKKVPNKEMQS